VAVARGDLLDALAHERPLDDCRHRLIALPTEDLVVVAPPRPDSPIEGERARVQTTAHDFLDALRVERGHAHELVRVAYVLVLVAQPELPAVAVADHKYHAALGARQSELSRAQPLGDRAIGPIGCLPLLCAAGGGRGRGRLAPAEDKAARRCRRCGGSAAAKGEAACASSGHEAAGRGRGGAAAEGEAAASGRGRARAAEDEAAASGAATKATSR
jgi:ribosomal protein L37E